LLYVLCDTQSILQAGPEGVGGKAWGLVRLDLVSANVPAWTVVTANAFAAHCERTPVGDAIDQHVGRLLGTARPDNNQVLSASREITDAIESRALSQTLRHEIGAAIEHLGGGPLVVRSSMVGEDSQGHSYAGQLRTLFFRVGLESVAQAIISCWASAFAPRVLAYRLSSGLSLQDTRIAVVLQKVVASNVSGVMFTANPGSGRRDQHVISAAYGYGDGVVGGACTTDDFVCNQQGDEVEVRQGYKDTAVLFDEATGQLVEKPLPEGQRTQRCVDRELLRHLVREGVRIQRQLGSPQDIEWTVADGELFILQSRPITSLPVPENRDGPRVVWDNSNIQESYNGVTTPLTFSFVQRGYEASFRQFLKVLGVDADKLQSLGHAPRNLLGIINGRIYYNINNWYRGLQLLPGFGRSKSDFESMLGLEESSDIIHDQQLSRAAQLRELPRLLKTSLALLRRFTTASHEVEAFVARFDSIYRQVDQDIESELSFSQLMGRLEFLHDHVTAQWTVPIVNDLWVMTTTGLVRRLLEPYLPAEAAFVQSQLLRATNDVASIVPTQELGRIAHLIRRDAKALAIVMDPPDQGGLELLRLRVPRIAQELDQWLERYGDRSIGELKLETKPLRDDFSFVLNVLKTYISRDTAPAPKPTDSVPAEIETLLTQLPLRNRLLLKPALSQARRAISNRERMRLARTRLFGLNRRLFFQLGQRLTEADRLPSPEDVFYLTYDELEAYHEGRSFGTNLAGLAELRRQEYRGYSDQDMPGHFETRGPVYHGNLIRPPAPPQGETTLLEGTGVFPGCVEAPVRLVNSPTEATSIDGGILTTVRTDPGWAPLFPTARGLLIERGSLLSHSAVIARELGIPCIVGIPGLTTTVRDGERVRMDGASGTVERGQPNEAALDAAEDKAPQ
jgi:pyruvate,water dikinase